MGHSEGATLQMQGSYGKNWANQSAWVEVSKIKGCTLTGGFIEGNGKIQDNLMPKLYRGLVSSV